MSALEEKRKESVKKNVKAMKSKFKQCCNKRHTFHILAGVGIACLLFWVVHAIYVLKFTQNKAILGIDTEIGQMMYQRSDVLGGLRGDADLEYLILPSKDDSFEITSNWEIPHVTKPLEVPTKPMKRLLDVPSNYTGYGPRHMHGTIGRRTDGVPHSWESELGVSLDREFPDYRTQECTNAPFYKPDVVAEMPAASVVIIFSNEPWETLMRSVHSVFNNTPPHLLYEIILVDDGSTYDDYTVDGNQRLVDYIKCCLPPKVKYTRTNTRAGITRARISGINAVKSDIFIILDSHIETEPGWIEPLLYSIQIDPTNFVMPMIDGIKKDAQFTPAGAGVGCSLGLIWKIMEHSLVPQEGVSPAHRILKDPWGYVSSPSMSGGLFAGNKTIFLDLGGYDLGMEGWGAENVEFGLRLWQCGAKLVCSPCSRVAHIFNRGQFYKQKGGEAVVNRLRTAAVWMDDFSALAWLFNGQPDWRKMGDISDMQDLRKNLQCHDFKWYLANVWPESTVHDVKEDIPYFGPLRHVKSGSCVKSTSRGTALETWQSPHCSNLIYYSRSQNIGSGNDDESYLDDLKFDWSRPDSRNQLYAVKVVSRENNDVTVKIIQVKSDKCLQLAGDGTTPGDAIFDTCIEGSDNQLWIWHPFDVKMGLPP